MSTSPVPGNAQPQAVSLHKAGTALNTQAGGGLPVWALGMGSKGKGNVEIRTEDTVLLSFAGGEQALAQTQATSSMQDTWCQAAQSRAGLFLTGHKSLHTTWLCPKTAFSTVNAAPSFSICLYILPALSSSTSYVTRGRVSLIPSDFIH